MLSKKGEPNKVDEAFLSRLSEFGISPLMNERRVNLRTMSSSAKERLENKVEERHGWALTKKQEQLREVKSQLEDERYEHGLEKEGLLMRLKSQKQKEKTARNEAGAKQDKLQLLVQAADLSTKEKERRLRIEVNEASMAERRLVPLRESLDKLKTELEVTSVDLAASRAMTKEQDKELRRVRSESDKELRTIRQELQAKCDEVELISKNFEAWKELEMKRRRRLKSNLDVLRQERDNLLQVNSHPLFFP